MENGDAQEYVFETYGHVAKRVSDLAAGMSQLGLQEKTNIGLFSINRAEWVIYSPCHANSITNYKFRLLPSTLVSLIIMSQFHYMIHLVMMLLNISVIRLK